MKVERSTLTEVTITYQRNELQDLHHRLEAKVDQDAYAGYTRSAMERFARVKLDIAYVYYKSAPPDGSSLEVMNHDLAQ